MAYGSDFSAAQSAALQERGLAQSQAQFDESEMQRALQFATQAGAAQRQFQYLRDVVNPTEWAMRGRQLDIEQARADRALSIEQRRADTAQGYLDIYKKQMDTAAAQGTPAQIKDHEFAFVAAAQDAERGMFDSPQHVSQLYPALSPAEANLMYQRSAAVRPSVEAQYRTAENARSLLNAYDATNMQLLPNYVDPTGRPTIAPVHWFDSQQTVAQKQQHNAALLMRNRLDQTGIIPNLRKSPLLSYDAESGQWQNNVPQPRWFPTGGTPTPTGPSTEAPMGWQPTTGGGWLKPVLPAGPPAPSPGRNITYISPPQVPGSSGMGNPMTQRKYTPFVYNRVNELVNRMGMDPSAALRQAQAEDQALSQ